MVNPATIQDLAILVSGAKKPCPDHYAPGSQLYSVGPIPYCMNCDGSRQVYILGERARKIVRGSFHWECAGCQNWPMERPDKCPGCSSIEFTYVVDRPEGWLPTILLPDERIDEGLLRELLEEAGFLVEYTTGKHSKKWWSIACSDPFAKAFGLTLLEATAKALIDAAP